MSSQNCLWFLYWGCQFLECKAQRFWLNSTLCHHVLHNRLGLWCKHNIGEAHRLESCRYSAHIIEGWDHASVLQNELVIRQQNHQNMNSYFWKLSKISITIESCWITLLDVLWILALLYSNISLQQKCFRPWRARKQNCIWRKKLTGISDLRASEYSAK